MKPLDRLSLASDRLNHSLARRADVVGVERRLGRRPECSGWNPQQQKEMAKHVLTDLPAVGQRLAGILDAAHFGLRR